jgi:hypothetical protein
MPAVPDFRCDCGAEIDAVEMTRFGDIEPWWAPGRLLEPCTCPHCPTCGHRLVRSDSSPHPVCETLGCPLLDVWQVVTYA